MCRHLTYIALNVTYLAHVSFSLLSPSSILSYSFTPLSLLLPPSLDESSRARSMCVEISGRVWGSIDFWSCEMTSLILYHRVYVWFVPGRKHQTSYSTVPPVKTFLLYIVYVSRIVLFVYVKVSVAVRRGAPLSCQVTLQQMPKQRKMTHGDIWQRRPPVDEIYHASRCGLQLG